MRLRDLLLALLVVMIWGVNFAVIKLGLQHFSPLALGVARFVLAAFPFVFFVRRPPVPIAQIALYGLLIFALQFGFLFTGIKLGMSAGLASLILQLQVFFTIGLAVPLLGERPTGWQVVGALLALCGVALVALHTGGEVNMVGLGLLVLAAASWGAGNIVSRQISNGGGTANVLGLVVWGSLFAVPPLLVVAVLLDPAGFVASFSSLDWRSVACVAYIVYLSTLLAFGVWSRLLSYYPVATVAPFTLLVPVFGFLGSAVLLGEPLQGWKVAASALVIAGLFLNLFGARLVGIASRRRTASSA